MSGFGILLVVLGHSKGVMPEVAQEIALTNKSYALYLLLVDWIYTFHMPLFFCISGFLFNYGTLKRRQLSFQTLAVKKFRRLLIPYLVISSLTYPIKVMLSRYAMFPVTFSLTDFATTILYPTYNTITFFWFLPTLFFIFLIAAVTLKVEHKPKYSTVYDLFLFGSATLLWFIFPYLISIELLNISGVLHNLVFFFAGFFACKYGAPKSIRINMLGPAALAVSLLLFLTNDHLLASGLVLAWLGLVFSYWLGTTNLSGPFAAIGVFSYQIYLFSWFPQTFIRILFGQVWFVNIWFSVFLSFALGLAIPIIVTLLLNSSIPSRLRVVYGY
ncbi:MAG: hypothetical protein FOGNACKC_03208 [Anaerolineae bacterium]|nr:hypothetical protein [Anaerolineae bacterium]